MAAHIGCRARLDGFDGNRYFGFIHSVDNNIGKITLQKVTCAGSADGVDNVDAPPRKLQGLLHFHVKEIKDLEIFSDHTSKFNPSLVSQRPTDNGPVLSRPKSTPRHLLKKKTLTDEHLVLGRAENIGVGMNRVDTHSLKSSDYDSSSDVGEGTANGDFTVIDKIDTVFQEAIAYIRRQSVIGLGLEGVNLGRYGELCWLQVSTKEEIFLFDIIALQKEAFENGLQDILESGNIQKVIHDCRQPSDVLHHQYDVQLVNVFDTQVADVFIYRMTHDGDYPRYVTSLHGILLSQECCDMKEINIVRYREKYMTEDQKIWAQRPAPEQILKVASKQVKHLLLLRVRQMEALLRMVNVGTDIYLGYVRDASAEDAKIGPTSGYLLPHAFQHMNTYIDFHRHVYRPMVRHRRPLEKDDRGFQENCDGVIDPCIIGSVGSILQAGPNYNSPVYRRRSDGDRMRRPVGPHYREAASLPTSPTENHTSGSPPNKHGHCVSRGPSEARRPAVKAERDCQYSSASSNSRILEMVREKPDIPSPNLRSDENKFQNVQSDNSSPRFDSDHRENSLRYPETGTYSTKTEQKAKSPDAKKGKSYFSDSVAYRPAGSLMNDLGNRRRRYRTDESDMEGEIKLGDYSCQEESDHGDSFSCIPSRESLGRHTSRERTSLRETIEAANSVENRSPEQIKQIYDNVSRDLSPHEMKYENASPDASPELVSRSSPGQCNGESVSPLSSLQLKRSPYAGLGRGFSRLRVSSPPGSGYSSDDSRQSQSIPSPQKLLNSFILPEHQTKSTVSAPESRPNYSTTDSGLRDSNKDLESTIRQPQGKDFVNGSSISLQKSSPFMRQSSLVKLLSGSSNSSSIDSSSESGSQDRSGGQRKFSPSQQY